MTPCPKPYRERLSKVQFKRRAFEIFDRDGYVCQYCGVIVVTPHCHHRVFKSQSGDDQWDNLVTTCYICHAKHGELKGAKLLRENDYTKIKELDKRYKATPPP